MKTEVLLDAGAMTRCRRRVHLDPAPAMSQTPLAPPDPAAEQRIADAAAHREVIRQRLIEAVPGSWFTVPPELAPSERAYLTEKAMTDGVSFIWGALLPADRAANRRGGVELLVRTESGYLPVLVVRHRVTDPGAGALTTALTALNPDSATADETRKIRSHPRDQLRLAHLRRMLQSLGLAARRAVGGVIGLDADVVVWHDLVAPSWPGGRTALAEYDARFADRLAIARAAATGSLALAEPSRILECRSCPWWPTCEAQLTAIRDVSLVVRGEDAMELRRAGVSTVDKLAALDPGDVPPIVWTS